MLFVNRIFIKSFHQSIRRLAMLSGKSYPHPRQEIWVGAYTDRKSEYFELRTVNETSNGSYSPLWHKYAPLGSAIADFLYDDLKHFDSDLRTVKAHIDAYNAGKSASSPCEGYLTLPSSGSAITRSMRLWPLLWNGWRSTLRTVTSSIRTR